VHFYTNDYYAYVNAHMTDNSNTPWVRILFTFEINVQLICLCIDSADEQWGFIGKR